MAPALSLMESFSQPERFTWRDDAFTVMIPNGSRTVYHHRATLAQLKTLLMPGLRLTRSGNISAHQPPPPPPQTYDFYLAQLVHYGLDFTFEIEAAKRTLEMAILLNRLHVPSPLLKLEKGLRRASGGGQKATLAVSGSNRQSTNSSATAKKKLNRSRGLDRDSSETSDSLTVVPDAKFSSFSDTEETSASEGGRRGVRDSASTSSSESARDSASAESSPEHGESSDDDSDHRRDLKKIKVHGLGASRDAPAEMAYETALTIPQVERKLFDIEDHTAFLSARASTRPIQSGAEEHADFLETKATPPPLIKGSSEKPFVSPDRRPAWTIPVRPSPKADLDSPRRVMSGQKPRATRLQTHAAGSDNLDPHAMITSRAQGGQSLPGSSASSTPSLPPPRSILKKGAGVGLRGSTTYLSQTGVQSGIAADMQPHRDSSPAASRQHLPKRKRMSSARQSSPSIVIGGWDGTNSPPLTGLESHIDKPYITSDIVDGKPVPLWQSSGIGRLPRQPNHGEVLGTANTVGGFMAVNSGPSRHRLAQGTPRERQESSRDQPTQNAVGSKHNRNSRPRKAPNGPGTPEADLTRPRDLVSRVHTISDPAISGLTPTWTAPYIRRPVVDRRPETRDPRPSAPSSVIDAATMAATPPILPFRFPCWCRAVYSWGGETNKDLGFIEGDLIECLNAGDGSWWVGRLRRDRRMMGSFPSNFVVVLDEGFEPTSRAPSPSPGLSPLKDQGGSQSRAVSPAPGKQKSTASRRPFSGYKNAPSRNNSSQSLQQLGQEKAIGTQTPPPTVLRNQRSHSRNPSRSPSPMPQGDLGSSPPPPPPPPHRVAVGGQRGRSPSPLPPPHSSDYFSVARHTPSPDIASLNGHTPPMVRDAMDEVMSSLQGMSTVDQTSEPQGPTNPWSPEAFDDLQKPRNTRPSVKPINSFGFESSRSDFSGRHQYAGSRHGSPDRDGDGAPQLSNFVQRMESRLKRLQDERTGSSTEDLQLRDTNQPPTVPAKDPPWNTRPVSSIGALRPVIHSRKSAYELGRTYTMKSNTTNSSSGVQSNATYSSTATSMTGQSVFSTGEMSATSAGSLARRNKPGSNNGRPLTAAGMRNMDPRPHTPATAASHQPTKDLRQGAQSAVGWENRTAVGLGGLTTPKVKKHGFFKKLLDGSKTVAASARSSIAVSQAGSAPSSPTKQRFNNGIIGMAGGMAARSDYGRDAAKEMGLGGGVASGGNLDWVNVRRDVNRSNTPGPVELQERAERCQMLDHPLIRPMDELYETVEGDEGADGYPVLEPFQISNPSFTGVDKAARFITSLPPMITPASLAQGYVCRPHRSDVQRLRAIFTWAGERVAWDEDFDGEIDTRRVIQTKRGCSHEVAMLVSEMCQAIGIHAEVIRGYLKTPGEEMDLEASLNRPNHYWNAVVVDDEWRMLDCSIASPTNPKRSLYSSISTSIAEPFYFLTRPMEFCYTHVPILPSHQHVVPNLAHDTLLSLPCALPPYFRQKCHLHNYDTSITRLEGLEIATLTVIVPPDIELVAEVETRSYLRDSDGDVYENGDAVVRKRALSQASWYSTVTTSSSSSNPNNSTNPSLSKRYTIKSLLPPTEAYGTLKIYAGKRGLMHSSKDITHPLALAIPISHSGIADNPAYDFLTRHPTPHAMRQDLYVIQPQCRRLVVGETFVFCVRQHGASVANENIENGGGGGAAGDGAQHTSNGSYSSYGAAAALGIRPVSPNPSPYNRPASAMSMMSSSYGGGGGGSDYSNNSNHHNHSNYNSGSNGNGNGNGNGISHGMKVKDKPAKLAIQTPTGKILRLNRRPDNNNNNNNNNNNSSSSSTVIADTNGNGSYSGGNGDQVLIQTQQGTVWETVVKVQERGVWRGLVLADRSARWCVWGEWDCV